MCTFIVDSKQTMHRFFWRFNLQMFFCSNEFGVWGFLLSVISEICCNFSQSTVKIPILIEYIPIMPCYPLSQYWVMMDKRSYHSNHYCGITYRREYLRPSRSHYRQSRKSWNRLLYRCLRPETNSSNLAFMFVPRRETFSFRNVTELEAHLQVVVTLVNWL